ncbi:STAS domain-containing protein [Actinomadura rifamycini]|uniref:STAS domain-containing protein n=1 Tax=Actinomadura rifamycini TaxID=31962 RepID=UPI0003F91C43|nr:STAS domain-containing protein [Actinomadura rifamycini]
MTPAADEAVTAMPPDILTVEEYRRGRSRVVRLIGELDLAGERRVRAAVGRALDARPRTLTLDLAGLRFMDCTGLSVMVWARNRLAEHGGVLRVRDPRPNVRRLLTFAGLDPHVTDGPAARTGPVRPAHREACTRDSAR